MKNQKSIFKSLFVLCMFGLLFSCERSDNESRPIIQDQLSETEKASEKVFLVVEDMPLPQGGKDAFSEYIDENIKYPETARKAGIEGRVFIQFVVDITGKLSEVIPVKGIGGGCDEEAVRLVRESAIWNPGKQGGHKVNVRMILPVNFKLN